MIEKIAFKHLIYPGYQATGNAARFIMPFAMEFCKGKGYDIGYGKLGWKLPGAIGVDINDKRDGIFHALTLPDINPYDSFSHAKEETADYIFSSHLLEHLPNWVDALNYWIPILKDGGVLFLYLPHYNQHYWRPWNNRKHIHILTHEILNDFFVDYCDDHNLKGEIYYSEKDLNDSFAFVFIKHKLQGDLGITG